jgi:hypothetical protein
MNKHTRTKHQASGYSAFHAGIVIVLLQALAFITTPAMAAEKGDYKAPVLDEFAITSEEDGDGDGDGVNETHIVLYSNLMGDRVFSMTTKGKLWAWSRESHAAGAESGKNYVIRDSDCDGTFDERYSLDDEFHLPDCVK